LIDHGADVTGFSSVPSAPAITLDQLRAVFAGVRDGLIVCDGAGRVVAFNQAALDLHDLEAIEPNVPIGAFESWFDLETPDGRPLPRPEWPASRVLRGERFTDLETGLRVHRTGRRLFLSYSGVPFVDRDGTLAYGVLTVREAGARRVSHKALRDSAQHYRELAAAIPHFVWMADAQGRWYFVNDLWVERVGLDPKQSAGEGWLDAVHPEDRAPLIATWTHARASGGILDGEARVRMIEGDWRWHMLRGVPLRDAQHRIVRWIGTCTDIDDQRRTDEALRRSEARFRTALRDSPICVYQTDRELRYTWLYNPLFEGVSVARAIGRTDLDILGREGGRELHEFKQRVLESEAGASAEIVVPFARGPRSLLVNAEPLRDEHDRVVGLTAAVLDTTQHREAERTIRESAERLRLVFKATNDAVWDWNITTGHVVWNEAVSTLFGWPAEQVEPTRSWWVARLHEDDRDRVLASIDRALAERDGDDRWTAEYRFARHDGSYAEILDRGYVVRAPEGRAPARMIGAMLDVTQRKRAEQHQALLLAELNHRVKNTLATVQSIASQTLRRKGTLEEFAETFNGRLRSLAAAHSLLTRGNWEGAELRDIVAMALKPYRQAENVVIDGPDAALGPNMALTFSMVLHELSTNAAKYGALSAPGGRVEVRWGSEPGEAGPDLVLRWNEYGGPPVTEPQEQGFGSYLIRNIIGYQLKGRSELTYLPEGARCEIRLPWPRLGSHETSDG
jgi:PAS domain S-box-containing protein